MKYSAYAECEIIHFVNCEISPFGRCEMKFAPSHLRSKYFTAELFHMAKPYFTRRRRISLKKAHIVLVDKCVLFSGGSGWIRTTEVSDNRFTVCPLWPLGKSPLSLQDWSWRTESNHQPADYKSAALPLSHASICSCDDCHFNIYFFACQYVF